MVNDGTALDELLFGLRPTPTGPRAPEGLHVFSIRQGAGPMLRAVPEVLSRRLSSGPGRMAWQVPSVTLRFTGTYTLDGELYQADAAHPLVLDRGPKVPFIRLPES